MDADGVSRAEGVVPSLQSESEGIPVNPAGVGETSQAKTDYHAIPIQQRVPPPREYIFICLLTSAHSETASDR